MTTKLITRSEFDSNLTKLGEAFRKGTIGIDQVDSSAGEYVQDIVSLGSAALSEELKSPDDAEIFLTDSTASGKHREAVKNLVQALEQGDPRSLDTWGGVLLSTVEQYLKRAEERLARTSRIDDMDEDIRLRRQLARRSALSLLVQSQQIQLTRRLRIATREAEQSAAQAKQAEEQARTSAGYVSGSTLTKRFEDLAKEHFWTSILFRVLTVTGVLAAVVGLFLSRNEVVEPGQAILRVSLLAAVLGLATYFGRQAAHHRDISTWASTIRVQLLTFDGYVEPVDNSDLKDQMRASFAARVFGSSPEGKDEPGVTLNSPLLSEVAAMFAKNTAK